MGILKEKAVENHKSFCSCSFSILKAFRKQADLSLEQAYSIAEPMARGKMGKCGAVLAAQAVLERVDPARAEENSTKLEERFLDTRKGSIYCRDLIGTCRSCVSDAADILEDMLAVEKAESKEQS